MNNMIFLERKLIILMCFAFSFFQYCDWNSPSPPDIKTELWNYLTQETWYIDRVIQCQTDTVTNSYLSFSIKFTLSATQNDSLTTRVDYSTANGAPAFAESGYLIIKNDDVENSDISAIRDDSVIVNFINVYSNFDQSIIEFVVHEIVNCSSSRIRRYNVNKELRLGDIAFRCKRR